MADNCKTCRYYIPSDPGISGVGLCCRYPPTTGESTLEQPKTGAPLAVHTFPTVREGHWCGEFKTVGAPPVVETV